MVVSLLCSACQGQIGGRESPVTFTGCIHRYHGRCLGDNETKCPWQCDKSITSVIDILNELPPDAKQAILITEGFKSLSSADQTRLREWVGAAGTAGTEAPGVIDPETRMNAIEAQEYVTKPEARPQLSFVDDEDEDWDEDERRRRVEYDYDWL